MFDDGDLGSVTIEYDVTFVGFGLRKDRIF